MTKHLMLRRLVLSVVLCAQVELTLTGPASPLDNDWLNPPHDARLRAYWWWINPKSEVELANDRGSGRGARVCDPQRIATPEGSGKILTPTTAAALRVTDPRLCA